MSALQLIMRKYAEKPPPMSKFKEDIFALGPLAIITMQTLSFEDALDLIRSKKEFITHPVDPRTHQLRLIWKVFLETHWQDFIRTNALFLLKRRYKWSEAIVVAVYAKLRQQWLDFVAKNDQPRFPLFYLPNQTPLGEEEYISIYAMTAFYYGEDSVQFYYESGVIDHVEVNVYKPGTTDDDQKEWMYDIDVLPREGQVIDEKQGSRREPATTKDNRLAFASKIYEFARTTCTIRIHYPSEQPVFKTDIDLRDVADPLNLAIAISVDPSIGSIARTALKYGFVHFLKFPWHYNWRLPSQLVNRDARFIRFTHKMYIKNASSLLTRRPQETELESYVDIIKRDC